MEELGAYVCKANIPSEGLDHNRKKKGFALGFRVLFEESIKDGELGVFFPFGAALSEKVIKIINNNVSLSKTILINKMGYVIPFSLNGSYSEGVFVSMKQIQPLFNGKLDEGYKITSDKHLTVIGKSADVFAHDLRNNLKRLPVGSVVYCVEKIEGRNVDIEFKRTIFGRIKYKITTDLHKDRVKKIFNGIVFNDKGKVIINPKNGEVFNFKVVGRDEYNTPFKTLEVLRPAALTKDFEKKVPFDYNFKKAEVFLTSISRNISKKEKIYYTWKTIERRAHQENLRTAPLLREMKVTEHNKFLKQCIGLTDTRSSINNFIFKKGINLFIEHKTNLDRIPYYSFKYIDAYYHSTYLCRRNFDLGF